MTRRARSWRLQLALLVLALLQTGLWLAMRSSEAELADTWASGPRVERAAAAHVLLARGAQPSEAARRALGTPDQIAARLLADPDPLLRSLAFTSAVCRQSGSSAQLAAVVAGLERREPGALRDFVLQCRKVGGESVGSASAMKRAEVDWFLRAGSLEAWPAGEGEVILEHLEPWLASIRTYLEQQR